MPDPLLPPPPPPGRRSRRATVVAGAVIALVAFAAGIGVGRLSDGDGGDGEVERAATATPEPTPSRSSSTPAATTMTPATSGAPTTAPPPGPPVPFATADEVLHPADLGALRATLDQFGFPAWWPLPDTLTTTASGFGTVQEIRASDRVQEPGTINALGSGDLSTRWLLETPDLASAEAVFVAKIPRDLFGVDAAAADKDTTTDGGVTEVQYYFDGLTDDAPLDYLIMTISDGVDSRTGQRVGTAVDLAASQTLVQRPQPVPTGPAPAKQFLGQAPASPDMEWSDTEAVFDGGLGPYFTTEPYGAFRATWRVAGDDFDDVIVFLADPANFPGDLELVSTGVFETSTYWVQPMRYQGLIGSYSMSSADAGGDTYLYLEFTLE